MTIDQICAQFRSSGIHGVDKYQQRLRDNERDEERLHDFFCEGYVALAFSKQGWAITTRESPDLEGRLNGIYLGIEVKHFRYKPDHDPIEDAAILIDGVREATWIPWLSETEGKGEDAWDQMARFARKYARQYVDGEFNVIFFWCSTQAHFDGTLMTAVNIYDEAIQEPSCSPGMENLSAVMMSVDWASVGYDARSIFWKPIGHANKPVTPELRDLLDEIRFP